jgi:hypothetical protein
VGRALGIDVTGVAGRRIGRSGGVKSGLLGGERCRGQQKQKGGRTGHGFHWRFLGKNRFYGILPQSVRKVPDRMIMYLKVVSGWLFTVEIETCALPPIPR